MNRILVLLLALTLALPVAAKQPTMPDKASLGGPAFTTITGSPLTINVGADQSYQVFNDTVPGSGQIYPSDATETADMGWMVEMGGTLYTPNFSTHPGGTATGGLGATTPFTEVSLSPVSGAGTTASPYTVEVVSALGSTGVSVIKEITYANGDNYFVERFRVVNLSATSQTITVFLGSDIYLASSDSGIPFKEPISSSPGGRTCAGVVPEYTILHLPLTPATRFTASGFSSVWSQIGSGSLNNQVATGCIDNGAALEWVYLLPPGSSRFIQAGTSFGAIPPIATFNITNVDPFQGSIGTEMDVTISGYGFLSNTTFDFGAGVTVLNLSVANTNMALARLRIDQAAPLGFRDVQATQTPGGLTATLIRGFVVGDAPVWVYTINGLSNVSQTAVNCVRQRFPANPSTNPQGWAPGEGEFYHEDPNNPFGPPATPYGLARAVLDCFLSPSAWNANSGQLYEQYCWDADSPRYIGEYPDIRDIDLRIYFSLDFQCNGPPPGTPVFQQNVNITRQLFSPLPLVRSGFELP
ncbi:MAG: hypothetical protein R3F18_15595 [Lysobacterales bacterium]